VDFKQKIVLCLKIRTEVVCIVMGDEDARAEIALKLILKAGNAKYFIPPLISMSIYNFIWIYEAKSALKKYLNTHHLNI